MKISSYFKGDCFVGKFSLLLMTRRRGDATVCPCRIQVVQVASLAKVRSLARVPACASTAGTGASPWTVRPGQAVQAMTLIYMNVSVNSNRKAPRAVDLFAMTLSGNLAGSIIDPCAISFPTSKPKLDSTCVHAV